MDAMGNPSPIERDWLKIIEDHSPEARQLLARVAKKNAPSFADRFYAVLLSDPRSSAFITHQAVEERLHASFEQWIEELLTAFDEEKIPSLVKTQKHVGSIHARVNIRIELVLRASRVMKRAVFFALIDTKTESVDCAIRREAALLAMEIIDLAIEVMSGQYTLASEEATRADQAYRSYAATVNMSLERESQRSALFNWSNRLLQDVMIGGEKEPLARLAQSSFGLWIRHKAHALFPTQTELNEILQLIDTVDRQCLPAVEEAQKSGDAATLRARMQAIVSHTEQLRVALDSLFDEVIRVESGRDALTQLLSRRFLPSVLSREIALARETGLPFALFLVDIDHFKSINDRYGHDVGDRALQRVADQLTLSARSGDFIFRYGGEEFLIVCVELTAKGALSAAERFRREIESLSIELKDHAPLKVTASVGVTVYDGHPDYERLIKQADEALYRAKEGGRNQVVLHESHAPVSTPQAI